MYLTRTVEPLLSSVVRPSGPTQQRRLFAITTADGQAMHFSIAAGRPPDAQD